MEANKSHVDFTINSNEIKKMSKDMCHNNQEEYTRKFILAVWKTRMLYPFKKKFGGFR